MSELTEYDLERVRILQTAFQYVNAGDPSSKASFEVKAAPLSAFYQDFINFREAWFDKVFCLYGDPSHACMAVATLSYFAEEFNRKRGKIYRCLEIIEYAMLVLGRFRLQSYTTIPKMDQQDSAYRKTAYYVHLTRQAVNLQAGNRKETVESVRWLMEYELEQNVAFQERQFLPLVYKCLEPSSHRTFTKEQLRQIDDDAIMDSLTQCLDICMRGKEPIDLRIRACSNCGKREKKLLKWKKCAKCQASFYCSRECQLKDWPGHKKTCQPAQVAAPRTGPYILVEGGVRPDGKQIVFKVYRDKQVWWTPATPK
jgi:hypothetical protein